MPKVGTSTQLHNIAGNALYDTGQKCPIDKKKIFLKGYEKQKDFEHDGKLYCPSCILQVRNGVVMEESTFSKYSESYTGVCKTCGKSIYKKFAYCPDHSVCKTCGKKIFQRYEYCFVHSSSFNKNKCKVCKILVIKPAEYCRSHDPEIPAKEEVAKVKRDTTFGSDNNLRRDLAFCQWMSCLQRNVPMARKEMIKVRRRKRDDTVTMVFCSPDCKDAFLDEPEQKMEVYRVWI